MASIFPESELDRELREYEKFEREQAIKDQAALQATLEERARGLQERDYRQFSTIWKGSGTEEERIEWSNANHQVSSKIF